MALEDIKTLSSGQAEGCGQKFYRTFSHKHCYKQDDSLLYCPSYRLGSLIWATGIEGTINTTSRQLFGIYWRYRYYFKKHLKCWLSLYQQVLAIELEVNNAKSANKGLLNSKIMSKAAKLKLYKTLIRRIATWACQIWSLTRYDIFKLSKKVSKIFESI